MTMRRKVGQLSLKTHSRWGFTSVASKSFSLDYYYYY
jgi:hypothetical protein